MNAQAGHRSSSLLPLTSASPEDATATAGVPVRHERPLLDAGVEFGGELG